MTLTLPEPKFAHFTNRRTNRLLVTLTYDRRSNTYSTIEHYTDLNERAILALGYVPARFYKEELRYANTRVYVKLDRWEVYDIRNDEHPNYETSSTLADYFESDSQVEFLKGMSRISISPIELKKFGGIAVVGLGIVFGLLLLGGVV